MKYLLILIFLTGCSVRVNNCNSEYARGFEDGMTKYMCLMSYMQTSGYDLNNWYKEQNICNSYTEQDYKDIIKRWEELRKTKRVK